MRRIQKHTPPTVKSWGDIKKNKPEAYDADDVANAADEVTSGADDAVSGENDTASAVNLEAGVAAGKT